MILRMRNILSVIVFFSVFMGVFGLPSHGFATQKYKKLTEEIITTFIEKTTKITSGQSYTMSTDEVVDYLNVHLEKQARFKSTIKYNIPGYPPQENSISLKKKDFIDSIKAKSETLAYYESSIKIENIKISRDKRKATVQTTGYETGVMPMPMEGGGTQDVNVEGESRCTQILVLSKKNILQMYNANCTTNIHFLEY